MNNIKQKVKHSTFGKGAVTGCTEETITVKFSGGERKFLFPQAFGKFLTFEDAAAQKEVDDLLYGEKKEKEAESKAVAKAEERMQRMRKLKITGSSQAVLNLKPDDKESAFENWRISTGTYLSGSAKGTPRIPDRLKPNSACLLTQCPKGEPESERRILGAFMVQEDFFGYLCKDGIVKAHEQYRLRLDEADAPLFWDYFPRAERLTRWGSADLKYFSNLRMQQILQELAEKLGETGEAEAADDFYHHFCEVNRLSEIS